MPDQYHESYEKLSDTTLDLHHAWMSLKEEHAAMLMEWVRRNDPALAHEMKDYLFTDGKPVTAIEESSE